LTALNGLAPIVSREDTERLFAANYSWRPENRDFIYLSRVEFGNWLQNAVICMRNPWNAHGMGYLIFLQRSGTTWSVTSYAKSTVII
jgi:hypothetical protein